MANKTLQLEVFFFFEQRELKIDFKDMGRAAAYQELNREGRIFSDGSTNVYLPLSKGMNYVRDSSSGLLIGFASKTEADRWCHKSILGYMHSDTEVHIKRSWEENKLDQQLRFSKQRSATPNSKEKPPLSHTDSDRSTAYGPARAAMPSDGRRPPPPPPPLPPGPRRVAMGSRKPLGPPY